MQKPAQRIQDLPANFFAHLEKRILTLQQNGADVIRLDIGSPDLPPATHIIEALTHSASQPDAHGYQTHLGPLALRQAWAEMYQRVHSVKLNPEQDIIPLMGSKEGIFNLLAAWINPGDIALIPDPGYMTYTRGTLFAGGEPYFLPLRRDNDYLPDLDSIPAAVLKRARILWLNYPNNPTGATADLAFFEHSIAFAHRHGLLLCHDAAYAQVCFDGYRAPSLLEIPGASEVAVEFNSLSKSHNMPGWRVGAAVGNPQALQALFRLKTNLDSGHFRPILEAAIAAMQGDQAWLAQRNLVYQGRRDLVVSALRAFGLEATAPKAAIYVWSPIPPGWTSLEFVNAVLEKALVSLTPGTVFGAAGEGFIRISITTANGRLSTALGRLAAAWEKLTPGYNAPHAGIA
jgi:LL-diaminopimelate aminotransferase